MWLERRLWPGIAELAMAFAGLVIGYLVVAVGFSLSGTTSLALVAGPLITAVAAGFYGVVGPRWSAAAEREDERERHREPQPLRPPRTMGPVALLATIVVGVGVALAGSVALGLLVEQLGLRVQEQSSVLEITQTARDGRFGLQALLLVVSALLLAPVAEEWLFRGLLFRRVAAQSGRWVAYGISALAFAAIHNNPAGFVVYLWLGLVFAAVLERTERLWVAVAVHMGNNAYVLAMLFTASGGAGA